MRPSKASSRTIAVTAVLAGVVVLGLLWRSRVRRLHDRAVVAAFVAAARRGQEARPCDVAVERVAQESQKAKALKTPSCSAKMDGTDAKHLLDGYQQIVNEYGSIAAEVSRFDTSTSFAESEATIHLTDIADPELKRAAEDARVALTRRDRVAATLLSEWRKLSQATSDYAARIEAGVIRGDKAACEAIERGVAAKSPAEIVVSCHKEFDASRAELDGKLSQLEPSAQR